MYIINGNYFIDTFLGSVTLFVFIDKAKNVL
jgi:hypothetical protein